MPRGKPVGPLAVVLIGLCASRLAFAGIVGTGTPVSCTEATFNTALAAGGNVTFNCGSSPLWITVTSTKTIITDTAIDGGGLITLSGGDKIQVFGVVSGVTLSLENLSVTQGNSNQGGAIYNSGTLRIGNCTFHNNISSGGHTAAGGAIYNNGMISVINSTFSYNTVVADSTAGGGAIYNNSVATVIGSTLLYNTASSRDYIAWGGAVFNDGGTVTVANSTFVLNSSGSPISGGRGGAIGNNEGMATLTNSTFSRNSSNSGTAIYDYPGGGVILKNTIIHGVTSPPTNCNRQVAHFGQNIDSDGVCIGGLSTDPLLDPAGLADNGGATETIAIQPGSPAINNGDKSICSTSPVDALDQRGYGRPGLGWATCSIGAYEYDAVPPCCQCPTSCAAPVNGSCGDCVAVIGASCLGESICVLDTPTATPTLTLKPTVTPSPSLTRTPTATFTVTVTGTRTFTPTMSPGALDCCQCEGFCAQPAAGTCGGCDLVREGVCSGGVCIARTPTRVPPTNTVAVPTSTPTAMPPTNTVAVPTSTPTIAASPTNIVALPTSTATVAATATATTGSGGGEPNVAIGSASGGAGSMVTVGLSLNKNGKTINIITPLQFTFDDTRLTFGTCTSTVAGKTVGPPNVVGNLIGVGDSGSEDPFPDGNFMDCTFTIKAEASGVAPLTFVSAGMADQGFHDYSATGTSGQVTVVVPTATATERVSPTVSPMLSPTSAATLTATSVPTVTPTPSLSPTTTKSATPVATPSATGTPSETATLVPTFRPGDCSGNGAVTVEELKLAVEIALGREDYGSCEKGDPDRDGKVTVEDLVSDVRSKLIP